jgi:hypothetical protein
MTPIPSQHGRIIVSTEGADYGGICKRFDSVVILQGLHFKPKEREPSHADDVVIVERKYIRDLCRALLKFAPDVDEQT